jgi:autotransporter-associated beta strand protein
VGGVLPASQVVTLAGASTYTGATQVNAGRLNLTGSLTSPITVASGASLAGSGSTTGAITLNAGSSIIGGTGTSFVTGNGASSGATAAGVTIIDPTAGTLGGHAITVVGYGTGTAPVLANFNIANFRGGVLTDDTANRKITFSYSNELKTWATTTGTWDNHLTANWSGGSDNLYYHNDAVVFGDIAEDATVTLVGAIAPVSLEVTHAANTYTFAGAAITGATGLTKSGAGTLVLNATNSFTGNVTINGGTLRAGAGQALGTQQLGKPVSQIVVTNGGAIDYNGFAEIYGYTIAGTGVGDTGALTNGSTTAIGSGLAQATNVKLAADASIGGIGDWFLVNNGYAATALDLNGHTLTKSGPNSIGLVNTTLTAGTVRVAAGRLALGDLASAAQVNGSAAAFTLDDADGATLAVVRNAMIGSLAGAAK